MNTTSASSTESIMKCCGQFLAKLPLGDAALQDLSLVIQQADSDILKLMYELSTYAGLTHDEACSRVLPILLQHCAIHLTEDLANGNCDYLPQAISQGSTALFTLQQLFNLSLQKCGFRNKARLKYYKLLALVGAARHAELKTPKWDLDNAIFAAKGLNGYQFEAYFSIASSNTESHDALQLLGHDFGIINHVANDIMNDNVRYTDLSEQEKAALRAWTLAHAKNIAEANIPLLTDRLPTLLHHFR